MRYSFKTYISEFGFLYISTRAFSHLIARLQNRWTEFILKPALGTAGRGLSIARGVVIDLPHKVSVGDNCYIGPYTTLGSEYATGFLKLGDNVHIVGRCSLDFTGGLIIGNDSFISEQTVIYTHDHGYNPHSEAKPTPLEIGSGVWIGARSVILPGVKYIGHKAILGVGTIVRNPVKDGQIVVGNPARAIRKR